MVRRGVDATRCLLGVGMECDILYECPGGGGDAEGVISCDFEGDFARGGSMEVRV